ncbi:protoheme IX farnesyltransferase [Lysinibacillus agricola]|uniref:Protoheme IX farnesyltransferase n=1 Tax=Lysinibacillus agricola TaxID=2590012 RepID=A0ABX7AMW7_9BACI|nr:MULTISPECIES: heme o synthase [Lysinibacillus]KOS61899.1 protoheme IX farnesyltransferase [Lysinibacillus sp. FJAT-14222]QQP11273.1 protoheme IX farnesyltransferase [Lysinibacillus agricola]
MEQNLKTEHNPQSSEKSLGKSSRSTILAQTIKTGIIKSNLIPMWAGLTLGMYKNKMSFVENIPEIIFATIGSALVIGAAGAFNNVYDRDIDALMPRTQSRPTVTGEMSAKFTLTLAFAMLVIGVAVLALASPLAAAFGFLGLFLYVVPYTMWTKRRTIYNTEIGSIGGAIPPLIGWAAVSSDITHPAILGLFFVLVIWQMPHFYAIAIRKHADYEAAKVPMLPVVKGMRRTYYQTNFYLILLILSSFLFGTLSVGIMLVALLLSIAWLVMSIYGYHSNKDQTKWATKMFVFSLIHMTILFSTVIVYSLVGVIFKLY